MASSGASGRNAKGEILIARNRRASFEYELGDRYEAGLVLVGSEVKSLRVGRIEIVDAYAAIEGGEAFLHGLYIGPIEQARTFGHDPRRKRKLLLHKAQISRISKAIEGKGATLVPVRVYFKDGRAKVEIAIAKGKTVGDRRQSIARKDAERETRAAIGRARKGN